MASSASLVLNLFPAGIDNTQRLTYVRGKVTISAGTYSVGGLTLNWSTLTTSAGKEILVRSQGQYAAPIQVTFFSNGTNSSSISSLLAGGYLYTWNKSTDKLQILATSASASAGTGPVDEEMTDGTSMPAGVLNDVILFEAVFVRSYG